MQGAVRHQPRPGNGVRYETTLRLTEEFLQKNYQKEDCYLDEVTNQFIEDFEFFLKTVGGAVRYNEEKVNRGRAEVLFWNRMLDPFVGCDSGIGRRAGL